MAKQPADRYALCRQMIAAPRDSLHAPFATVPAARPPGRNTRRRGWVGWVVGLAILLRLAVGLLGWLPYRQGCSPPLAVPVPVPQNATPNSGTRPAVPRQQRSEPASETAIAAGQVITEPPPPVPEVPVTEMATAVLRKVDPVSAEAARPAAIEGVVSLRVRATPAGIPEHIEILQGLEPGLDQRAVEALSRWLCSPATAESGEDAPWSGVVQLHFRLLNRPQTAPPSPQKR